MAAFVYSPAGRTMREERSLAVRLKTLRGARIGVLDNSKANARLLLTAIALNLAAENEAQLTVEVVKPSPSRPCPSGLVDRLRGEADAVIVGTADCGSCTTYSVYDLIELESSGLPCVLVASDSFRPLAHVIGESQGYSQLPMAITSHPIGGLEAEVIVQKAALLTSTVTEQLTFP